MKFLFMFLVINVFTVSANARNNDVIKSIKKPKVITKSTKPTLEINCNTGYHEFDNKCEKLYCNDLPKVKNKKVKSKKKAKAKKMNSSSR